MRNLMTSIREFLRDALPGRAPETSAVARQLFHRLFPGELPCGIYLTDHEGRLLEANLCLREMLSLPSEGLLDCTITDFWWDSTRKQDLMQQLEQTEGDDWCSTPGPVHMHVKGCDLVAREAVRALREPRSGRTVGYVGCLVDVTELEHHRRLVERSPVGVYRLDGHDKLVYANDALARILGYNAGEEIKGRPCREFYAIPEEADAFRDQVCAAGYAIQEIRELVTKGGEFFFASVSSAAFVDPDGKYAGREGTLVDVTALERYRRSLNDVPVGFYEVRVEGSKDIIRACNERFAAMFGFPSTDAVVGTDIRELYGRPEGYDDFMDAIESHHAEQSPLLGYPLRVKTVRGKHFMIEVNSRLLTDRSGHVIGRTGVVREIPTHEQELLGQIRALQADIGRLLHAYTSALIMVRYKTATVSQLIGPDPFSSAHLPSAPEVNAALAGPTDQLTKALAELIVALETDRQERGISEEDWQVLQGLPLRLRDCESRIQYGELRPPVLRRLARRAIELCGADLKGRLPRVTVKRVVQWAREVERIACCAALRQVHAEIVAMDHEVRTLRDYVTAGARQAETRNRISIWHLVQQAMTNLEEFAQNKGVEFRPRDYSRDARVEVVERDVLRALSSLLHNAIKYSWSRKEGEPPWVAIVVRLDTDRILVEFENHGVPIPRDEIESDLIFELGYRGRLSSDRGRLGTGIGLHDARTVAEQHGGDVRVRSRPAATGARDDDYEQPFITTVTLALPAHGARGG